MALKKKARVASAGASEIVWLDGSEFKSAPLSIQAPIGQRIVAGRLQKRHLIPLARAILIAGLAGFGGCDDR